MFTWKVSVLASEQLGFAGFELSPLVDKSTTKCFDWDLASLMDGDFERLIEFDLNFFSFLFFFFFRSTNPLLSSYWKEVDSIVIEKFSDFNVMIRTNVSSSFWDVFQCNVLWICCPFGAFYLFIIYIIYRINCMNK